MLFQEGSELISFTIINVILKLGKGAYLPAHSECLKSLYVSLNKYWHIGAYFSQNFSFVRQMVYNISKDCLEVESDIYDVKPIYRVVGTTRDS